MPAMAGMAVLRRVLPAQSCTREGPRERSMTNIAFERRQSFDRTVTSAPRSRRYNEGLPL
jgi:hypothetical protein